MSTGGPEPVALTPLPELNLNGCFWGLVLVRVSSGGYEYGTVEYRRYRMVRYQYCGGNFPFFLFLCTFRVLVRLCIFKLYWKYETYMVTR